MLGFIKDAFIDKETGSLKISSLVAGAAGGVGGSMLLSGLLLPIIGPAAAFVGPALGAAAAIAIKEVALPMITGRGADTQTQAGGTQGFRPATQGQGRGQEQDVEVPNVPGGRGAGMGGRQ